MSTSSREQDLIQIRTTLGFTQSAMANLLDLPLRDYQAMEWGESVIPDIYVQAAERIAMKHAVLHGDARMAPAAIRDEAIALARLVKGS